MRRAAVSCLGQLRPRQLDALLETGRVLRCRGRLAHADVCLWFSRPRLAQHNNRAALSLLRQAASRTQVRRADGTGGGRIQVRRADGTGVRGR